MHARLSGASAQTVRASKHPPWLSVGAGRRGGGGQRLRTWLRAVAPPRAPQPSRGLLCTGGDVMVP